MTSKVVDPINPSYYKNHPSGIECIQVTECMDFCLGNAVSYIWRAPGKGGAEDIKKALWYVNRKIIRNIRPAIYEFPFNIWPALKNHYSLEADLAITYIVYSGETKNWINDLSYAKQKLNILIDDWENRYGNRS